ncbi:MAG: PTS glucose transporter subunit IIA [Butyricicoccus sp.]
MAGIFGLFKKKMFALAAPMKGECVPLSQVPDPTFADGLVGKGAAIIPADGKVYAPADGEITMAFQTGHAVAMTTADGIEVLIHIGLETVSLEGAPFTVHVVDGQKVKKGDLLIEADLDAIRAAGRETITPMVVCNADAYASVDSSTGRTVQPGDEIITVKP